MKRIECISMDWAGSAVDYGCFAPVAAFLKTFNEIGINITMEQARRPMGMAKIDHIRELFKMDGVGEEFEKLYHRPWNEQDVIDMNAKFEEYLFASLANYTDPIPGVIDTLNELDTEGIEPMSHVFPVNNVFREDVVTNGDNHEAMLANAPQQKEQSYKVPRTFA